MKKHPESLSQETESFVKHPHLPTHVVDVGTLENPHLRLFELPITMHECYITLSYCWGTARFLTTLLLNLETHKEKLGFLYLPLTFQDAIITTRNLSFRCSMHHTRQQRRQGKIDRQDTRHLQQCFPNNRLRWSNSCSGWIFKDETSRIVKRCSDAYATMSSVQVTSYKEVSH